MTFQGSPKGWVSVRQTRPEESWIRLESGRPVSGFLGAMSGGEAGEGGRSQTLEG